MITSLGMYEFTIQSGFSFDEGIGSIHDIAHVGALLYDVILSFTAEALQVRPAALTKTGMKSIEGGFNWYFLIKNQF